MAKAINVKVARTKVIKALEVKVEEMKNQQMNYDLLVSKHEADYANWKSEVAKKSLKTNYQQNQKHQKILSKQVDMVATILVVSRTGLQKSKMQFVFSVCQMRK